MNEGTPFYLRLSASICGSFVSPCLLCLCGEIRPYLNFRLSILSAFIRDSKVDGGTPSLAAAPCGPETRPRAWNNASSMIALSSADTLSVSADLADCGGDAWAVSQLSSTEKFSLSQTITERSITFCNSRMLPGHGYDWKS